MSSNSDSRRVEVRPLDAGELRCIRERLEATTPGGWEVRHCEDHLEIRAIGVPMNRSDDAEFLLGARSDVRRLLDALGVPPLTDEQRHAMKAVTTADCEP